MAADSGWRMKHLWPLTCDVKPSVATTYEKLIRGTISGATAGFCWHSGAARHQGTAPHEVKLKTERHCAQQG